MDVWLSRSVLRDADASACPRWILANDPSAMGLLVRGGLLAYANRVFLLYTIAPCITESSLLFYEYAFVQYVIRRIANLDCTYHGVLRGNLFLNLISAANVTSRVIAPLAADCWYAYVLPRNLSGVNHDLERLSTLMHGRSCDAVLTPSARLQLASNHRFVRIVHAVAFMRHQ